MAELALAIAPICFTAFQGFVELQSKIRLFRHYKKEIKWLLRKVEVQEKCYKNEIQFLVIDALEDKHLAQSMITNDNHSHWKSPALLKAVEQHLRDQYSDFLSAYDDVQQALNKIQGKLAVFAPPDIKSPFFMFTRDKFRLAFNKDQYEEDINVIKESITELKRVRKTAGTFAKKFKPRKQIDPLEARGGTLSHITTTQVEIHHKTVKKYTSTRCFSASLQAFLQEQWTCRNPSHSQHKGTLFLSCVSEKHHEPSVVWLLESSGIHEYTTRQR